MYPPLSIKIMAVYWFEIVLALAFWMDLRRSSLFWL